MMNPSDIALALTEAIQKICPIDGVSLGDIADKQTWNIAFRPDATNEQKAAAQAVVDSFDPNAPVVPSEVSPRQARLALLGAGILDQVDAAIAQQPKAVQVAWDYSVSVRRDNPLIAQIAAGLGMTEAQVDQLFITAATL